MDILGRLRVLCTLRMMRGERSTPEPAGPVSRADAPWSLVVRGPPTSNQGSTRR